MGDLPPCVIFEDEHLLVVNKPAGMNTHSPSPYAGEGIYEWLKHREPRWAGLAIIHRLDKETSGVMVFGKTPFANKSLTKQFTERTVDKEYILLTDRTVDTDEFTVVSAITRVGDHYISRPLRVGGERAETHFRVYQRFEDRTLVEAKPITGRTHQIRVHAASKGFPIYGDTLYGGTDDGRVYLHAGRLAFRHPLTGREEMFTVPFDFNFFINKERSEIVRGIVDERQTNAWRLIHGAAHGWPGFYVEKLGRFLLSQSEQPLTEAQLTEVQSLMISNLSWSAYHKILSKQVRKTSATEASPQHAYGDVATAPVVIRENGVKFELSFNEGYSVGLFLDQRDNRRRFLVNHVAADFPLFTNGPKGSEVLNTFAYTCGFSVCAALAGTRTTSLDLSKKYLEWGKRNFALNGLDASAHDFIFGDVFDWMRRLAKKGRMFDAIVLDPPTFSQSKEGGAFQAEKDYGRLASTALPLLKSGGVLLASTNAARLEPEKFLEALAAAVKLAKRKIARQHYVPQPPDFPISRDEPAYLKTVWLRID
jgi:23S rRNA (cytosine1962-C5)-methyltransferase